MSAPILYHVDRFGAFDGATSLARRSPADKDEVWLIPESATTEAPPPVDAGEVAVLRAGAWSVVADHRGQTAYQTARKSARLIEEPGALRVGETLTPPPSPAHEWIGGRWLLPLAHATAARLAEVGAELVRRNAAGFEYGGKLYQIDDLSQARIMALAMLARARGLPDGFRFIAADNEPVRFDEEGFVDFAATAARTAIARRLHARALKNRILAAASATALAAIDIDTGWD